MAAYADKAALWLAWSQARNVNCPKQVIPHMLIALHRPPPPIQVMLATYERRKPQAEVINEMPLYPTEAVLFDENQVPTVNYTGERWVQQNAWAQHTANGPGILGETLQAAAGCSTIARMQRDTCHTGCGHQLCARLQTGACICALLLSHPACCRR